MNLAIPLTVAQADALRRGLPLPPAPPARPRAYPEGATTDELRARLIALGRGISALVEEDPDLTPPTVEACQHHAKDACRILLCLRVDQRPQEDFAGPMSIPFPPADSFLRSRMAMLERHDAAETATDSCRTAFQIGLDAIGAEAERQAGRVRP